MKVYLDDERSAPEGWMCKSTVQETISLLKTRQVKFLSLDNDLGKGVKEGYTVLDWLEKEVHGDRSFPIPELTVHSANPARAEYMTRAIASIHKIRQQQMEETKQKVLEAVQQIREEGYTIISEDWGIPADKYVCVLGCLLLTDNPENEDLISGNVVEAAAVASQIMEVSPEWLNSFIEGYDDVGNADDAMNPEGWNVGWDIRQAIQPIPYAQYIETHKEDSCSS